MKVLFLGPLGTFAHAATDLLRTVGPDPEFVARPTVQEIVHEVESGAADMGLVPIENSVEGGVTGTVDVIVFETERVIIREEVAVPVSFTAFRRADDSADLATVFSHPVGLAQCTRWWRDRGLECRSASSTAEACRVVAGSSEAGVVAIGSDKAGVLAGLVAIERGIEDHPGAQTRFALVARTSGPASGDDRTTIVVTPSVSAEPGVLLRILQPISDRGINLSNILSRPLRQALGVYCFVLTLDRHCEDLAVIGALEELRAFGCQVKMLGSYPAWRDG